MLQVRLPLSLLARPGAHAKHWLGRLGSPRKPGLQAVQVVDPGAALPVPAGQERQVGDPANTV